MDESARGEIRRIETVIEQIYGRQIALQSMLFGIAAALPEDAQLAAGKHFATDLSVARTMLLNTPTPEGALESLESTAKAIADRFGIWPRQPA